MLEKFKSDSDIPCWEYQTTQMVEYRTSKIADVPKRIHTIPHTTNAKLTKCHVYVCIMHAKTWKVGRKSCLGWGWDYCTEVGYFDLRLPTVDKQQHTNMSKPLRTLYQAQCNAPATTTPQHHSRQDYMDFLKNSSNYPSHVWASQGTILKHLLSGPRNK